MREKKAKNCRCVNNCKCGLERTRQKMKELYINMKTQQKLNIPLVKVNGKGQLYLSKPVKFSSFKQVTHL
jgi:hypothetical protein